MFKHVKFKIWNETDGYWVTAKRDERTGVYYVTGHVTEEADATVFYPVNCDGKYGQIMVKGCEDDTYIITEIETANGYTLLRDDIHVTITATEDESRICDIYSKDILGVLQNDPHYAFDSGLDLTLANIPQSALPHVYLTGSASVDGNEVTMLTDNGSTNAHAPLTVVNTRGFDLPKTGDYGTWVYSFVGVTIMSAAAIVILLLCKQQKKEKSERQ